VGGKDELSTRVVKKRNVGYFISKSHPSSYDFIQLLQSGYELPSPLSRGEGARQGG